MESCSTNIRECDLQRWSIEHKCIFKKVLGIFIGVISFPSVSSMLLIYILLVHIDLASNQHSDVLYGDLIAN